MKRGRGLARQSEKAKIREAEHRAAAKIRREQVRGLCEGATPVCPTRDHQGHHAHHVARRSQGGENVPENLRWLCWEGHDWVHRNIDEARARGLLA